MRKVAVELSNITLSFRQSTEAQFRRCESEAVPLTDRLLCCLSLLCRLCQVMKCLWQWQKDRAQILAAFNRVTEQRQCAIRLQGDSKLYLNQATGLPEGYAEALAAVQALAATDKAATEARLWLEPLLCQWLSLAEALAAVSRQNRLQAVLQSMLLTAPADSANKWQNRKPQYHDILVSSKNRCTGLQGKVFDICSDTEPLNITAAFVALYPDSLTPLEQNQTVPHRGILQRKENQRGRVSMTAGQTAWQAAGRTLAYTTNLLQSFHTDQFCRLSAYRRFSSKETLRQALRLQVTFKPERIQSTIGREYKAYFAALYQHNENPRPALLGDHTVSLRSSDSVFGFISAARQRGYTVRRLQAGSQVRQRFSCRVGAPQFTVSEPVFAFSVRLSLRLPAIARNWQGKEYWTEAESLQNFTIQVYSVPVLCPETARVQNAEQTEYLWSSAEPALQALLPYADSYHFAARVPVEYLAEAAAVLAVPLTQACQCSTAQAQVTFSDSGEAGLAGECRASGAGFVDDTWQGGWLLSAEALAEVQSRGYRWQQFGNYGTEAYNRSYFRACKPVLYNAGYRVPAAELLQPEAQEQAKAYGTLLAEIARAAEQNLQQAVQSLCRVRNNAADSAAAQTKNKAEKAKLLCDLIRLQAAEVTLQHSLNSGNCRAGSEAFCVSIGIPPETQALSGTALATAWLRTKPENVNYSFRRAVTCALTEYKAQAQKAQAAE